MAVTNFGVNHPLAQKLWAKRLMVDMFSAAWIGKLTGNTQQSIIQRIMPGNKGAGDKITFGIRKRLTGKGVRGDAVLEGNEEALSVNTDALVINQLRHAVRSAGRMSQERVPFSIREEAKNGLVDWGADRMDTGFFLQTAGSPVILDEDLGTYVAAPLEYTGLNPVVQPDAAHMVLANPAAANEAALTSADIFTLAMVDRAVARAKTTRPLMRKARVDNGEFYVLILHPSQVAQLRQDNSAGSWKDINMAAMAGGDIKKNPIFSGAIGYYNGCIIHESDRIPPAVTSGGVILPNVRRAVLLGAQAAAIGFGSNTPTDPEDCFTWKEESFDYGNQLGVAAGTIMGVKKVRFAPSDPVTGVVNDAAGTDFASMVLSSYSPAVI